ncbi:hypothetical protein ACHAWF_018339, partial [Thalassiosira exigua]
MLPVHLDGSARFGPVLGFGKHAILHRPRVHRRPLGRGLHDVLRPPDGPVLAHCPLRMEGQKIEQSEPSVVL